MKLAISIGGAVAALFLAGSAQAQTTTNCRPTIIGMPSAGVTCDTNDWSPPQRAAQPIDPHQLKAKRCTFADHLLLNEELCAARAVAADRKTVTDQIAAGDCSGALKSALELGDMQFAREVRDFCSK